MTEQCDALKVLAKLETRLQMKGNKCTYECVMKEIEKMRHEMYTEIDNINDLKKELGLYHN